MSYLSYRHEFAIRESIISRGKITLDAPGEMEEAVTGSTE